MGSVTPIHSLRYPSGGDAVQIPTDISNLAGDVDAQLPYVGTAAPTKKPGLVWFNTTTGVMQITDGSTWYNVTADSGWLSTTLASGYAVQSVAPKYRRINGVMFHRGTVKPSSGSFAASAVLQIVAPGGIAAGYRPATLLNMQIAGPAQAADVRAFVDTDGSISIVTGATAPAYVDLAGLSGYVAEA